jgi:glycosyltransferase involved in cell wall biosynthesis
MKLSIILPVYRVEATLDRSIESILSQDFSDYELILVDDGSPDSCPRRCDEWAQRDSRISVIHKPNGGLGDARNAGVRVAKGDYITFADSDDYLHPDTYAPLFKVIDSHPEYDFVEYSVAVRYGGRHESWLRLDDGEYDNIDTYWTALHAHRHCYVWNKIFKRSLFDGVLFPVGHVYDDANTFPRLLKKCSKMATSKHGLYYYCDNSESLSANADGHQLELLLDSLLHSGMPIDDCCYMDLLNIQMDVYELTGKPLVLPSRKVALRMLNGKQKLKGIVLNTLGINSICRINKLIHRLWKCRS